MDAVEEVIMSKVEADCAALGYYVREVESPSYISYSGWVIALAYQSGGGYDYHFYKKHMLAVEQVAELLGMIAEEKKISFDKEYAEQLYLSYNARRHANDDPIIAKLTDIIKGKKVLHNKWY